MACLQSAQFRLDAEQFADEIFQVRREFDDEFGALLICEARRILARG